jgi:transglutaminase-like putative cysteine protease
MSVMPQRYPIAFLGWLSTVAMSLSFLPALSDHRFLPLGALLAAVVVGTGVLLRAFHTPSTLVMPVQLVVLAETLQVAFGGHQKLGLLPTRGTVSSIGDLFSSGFTTAQRYAAPAPRDTGLLMMVLLVIGLVAICVDALAMGLGRVPLAGLPLLAMYTVPVASLPHGVPFLAFVPGAACFIAMLSADERDRLAHWGRLVLRDRSEPARAVDLSSVRDSGRRIGLVALSVAVVLPVFIPTLSPSLLDGGRGDGSGPGGSSTLSFQDPMVSLAHSLQRSAVVDLIDVTGDAPPQYLRLTVLDRPGPISWTASPVSLSDTLSLQSLLPGPTGLDLGVSSRSHTMVVDLTNDFPKDSSWLPVPFDSHFVGAGSEFGYVPEDQTVSVKSDTALESLAPYRVSYSTVEPTADQLRNGSPPPDDIVRRDGQVPDGVPLIVSETAREVTAGVTSPYEQALLLQSFFRDHDAFSYDVNAGYGYGYDAMKDFLTERRGFCQHFAATMAMMARTLGIPARVVVGFLQPDHTDASGRYVITSHNVHAWPELYFGGVGWVRFEPTPSVHAPFPQYAPQTTAPDPSRAPTSAPTSIHDPLATASRDTGAAASNGTDGSGGSGLAGAMPSTTWLLTIGLVLVALLPWMLRAGVRRSRLRRPMDGAEAAEAAWTELRDRMSDLRMPWTGSMTPRARERAVSQHLGDDHEALTALHRLTLGVERARYADSQRIGTPPADDLALVTAALAAGVSRARRLRAGLLPASLMPDLRVGFDRAMTRVRRPRPVGG